MECGQIQKMIPAYWDGIASPEERSLVERHVSSCDPCRKVFEEHQRARDLVKTLEEVEPPPGFAQRIMAQVREEAEEKGFFKKLFYPLHIKIPIQAVATIVIAVLAIQVYRSVEPQKTVIPPPGLAVPRTPEPEPPRAASKEAYAPASQPAQVKEEGGSAKERKAKDQQVPLSGGSPAETVHQAEKAAAGPEVTGKTAAQVEVKKSEIPSAEGRIQAEPQASAPAAPRAPVEAPRKMEKTTPSPSAGIPAARETEENKSLSALRRAVEPPKSADSSLRMETAPRKKAEVTTLTLRAKDPAAAARAVEEFLRELGGEGIAKVRAGGVEIVTAEFPSVRIEELIEKMKGIGEVTDKLESRAPMPGKISLRFEILEK